MRSFATSRLWGDLRVTSNKWAIESKEFETVFVEVESADCFWYKDVQNLAKVESLAALCLLMEIFWSLEDANEIAKMHSRHQLSCNWHSDIPTMHTEVVAFRQKESKPTWNSKGVAVSVASNLQLALLCSFDSCCEPLRPRHTSPRVTKHESRVQTITSVNKWKQMKTIQRPREKWK